LPGSIPLLIGCGSIFFIASLLTIMPATTRAGNGTPPRHRRGRAGGAPAAYNDLQEARSWYQQINTELPKQFSHQLKITITKSQALPTIYALRYKQVHIANLAVFPYAVHFLIETDSVIILAIFRIAIDPGKRKKKITGKNNR
jgi:hypothetical protein